VPIVLAALNRVKLRARALDKGKAKARLSLLSRKVENIILLKGLGLEVEVDRRSCRPCRRIKGPLCRF
jgi:hypothetical protein